MKISKLYCFRATVYVLKIGEEINSALPNSARLKLNNFSKKLKNNVIVKRANKIIIPEIKYSGHSKIREDNHIIDENSGCWSPNSKAQINLSKNIGSNSATSSCWKLVGNKWFLKLKINIEHKEIEVRLLLFLINFKNIT